ncbi:Antitoxin HigA [compost metagenome]
MPEPDPIAVIKIKMDDLGLKNKDLIPIIGSESHVSSVLSGRRKLTLDMARSLAAFLQLPSWVFINDQYGLDP